ncbi:MAG: hypothetical protein WCK49_09240, partial [Myxococcaceae bacterium]
MCSNKAAYVFAYYSAKNGLNLNKKEAIDFAKKSALSEVSKKPSASLGNTNANFEISVFIKF